MCSAAGTRRRSMILALERGMTAERPAEARQQRFAPLQLGNRRQGDGRGPPSSAPDRPRHARGCRHPHHADRQRQQRRACAECGTTLEQEPVERPKTRTTATEQPADGCGQETRFGTVERARRRRGRPGPTPRRTRRERPGPAPESYQRPRPPGPPVPAAGRPHPEHRADTTTAAAAEASSTNRSTPPPAGS